MSHVDDDQPLNLTIHSLSGGRNSVKDKVLSEQQTKTSGNVQQEEAEKILTESSPEQAQCNKMPKRRVNQLNSKVKMVLKNLQNYWPPEKIALLKNCGERNMKSNNSYAYAVRLLKGKKYSPSIHFNVDFIKVLTDSFETNSFLDKNQSRILQQQTGLSEMAIKLWFKWKREKSGVLTPIQVLSLSFQKCQYLSSAELEKLTFETSLEPAWIRSWFRFTRAFANVFDKDNVDKEEVILWRMFHFRKIGLSDSDVYLMSHILDMDFHHVYQIFSTWSQRYGVSNQITPMQRLPDISSVKCVSKNSLSIEAPTAASQYLFHSVDEKLRDDKFSRNSSAAPTPELKKNKLPSHQYRQYQRSHSCPAKLLFFSTPFDAYEVETHPIGGSCIQSSKNTDHLTLKTNQLFERCHSDEHIADPASVNFCVPGNEVGLNKQDDSRFVQNAKDVMPRETAPDESDSSPTTIFATTTSSSTRAENAGKQPDLFKFNAQIKLKLKRLRKEQFHEGIPRKVSKKRQQKIRQTTEEANHSKAEAKPRRYESSLPMKIADNPVDKVEFNKNKFASSVRDVAEVLRNNCSKPWQVLQVLAMKENTEDNDSTSAEAALFEVLQAQGSEALL